LRAAAGLFALPAGLSLRLMRLPVPRAAVRMDCLEKVEKTEKDRACPHGVQFYDVVVDGKRHPRAAWSYEAPRPEMARVAGRFGFWEDVEVG
jgi:uncharacterized protein (DUF427 family)